MPEWLIWMIFGSAATLGVIELRKYNNNYKREMTLLNLGALKRLIERGYPAPDLLAEAEYNEKWVERRYKGNTIPYHLRELKWSIGAGRPSADLLAEVEYIENLAKKL